jgi:hypothetical protein
MADCLSILKLTFLGVSQTPIDVSSRQHHYWRDRECNHHPRAEFDQEPDRGARPGEHRTKKENRWYFGLKAHIGADSREGVVHLGGQRGCSRRRSIRPL